MGAHYHRRVSTKKIVIISIVLALIVAVALIGMAWWSDSPAPATLDYVKEQAQRALASTTTSSTQPPAGTLPGATDTTTIHQPSPETAERIQQSRTLTPDVTEVAHVKVPQGIYAYETEGSEKVHLGPGQSHRYPDETYVRYTPTECGFEAVWEPLEGRKNVYRLCVDPLSLVTYEQHHAFFGQTDHRNFYCDPPLVLETSGEGKCWQEGKSVSIDSTVGVERVDLDVDGQTIPSRHITIDAQLHGDANGTQHSEWWFSDDGLLLLQVVSNIATDAKTILGGITYTEDVTLKIKSLEPVG